MKNIVTVVLVGILAMAAVTAKPHKHYDPCNNKIEWTAKEYKNEVKRCKEAIINTRDKLKRYDTMIANWSNVDDTERVINWKDDIQSLANLYSNIVANYERCSQPQSDWQDISVKQYEQASEGLNYSASLLQLDSITAADYKHMLAIEYSITITNLQVLERYYGTLVMQQ